MNKVILTGNLTRDPEIKHLKDGKGILSNTIAVNGDNRDKTFFADFISFGQQAEFLSNYAKKGSKIALEGRLTIKEYEKKDGTKVKNCEIVADRVELLSATKEVVVEELEPTKPAKEETTQDIDEADLPW